VLFRSQSCR